MRPYNETGTFPCNVGAFRPAEHDIGVTWHRKRSSRTPQISRSSIARPAWQTSARSSRTALSSSATRCSRRSSRRSLVTFPWQRTRGARRRSITSPSSSSLVRCLTTIFSTLASTTLSPRAWRTWAAPSRPSAARRQTPAWATVALGVSPRASSTLWLTRALLAMATACATTTACSARSSRVVARSRRPTTGLRTASPGSPAATPTR